MAFEDVKFERAVIYTPEPGDVVVLECSVALSQSEADQLEEMARKSFGREVEVVVVGDPVRFAGVVRG